MLTVYLRCCSECSTVRVGLLNLMTSKQWFSNFFSPWDTLLQVYFWWITPPKSPLTTQISILCSSVLLSPSLVPVPPCKLSWPLFLTPLVISSPNPCGCQLLVLASWLGGPSISTACGDLAMGPEGWGGWLDCGGDGGQC